MSDLAAFDAVLAGAIEEGGPGAAVAVVRDGALIHRKAYGLADLEWGIPLAPDCSFRIASLTKQFTAAAIMRLAEVGALSLDDPLERHLPDWDPRSHAVTLGNLLNHTSGIRNHDYGQPRRTERANIPRAQVLRETMALPFDFEPGQKYRYCNSGYILLGAVIEAVSGQPYEAFLYAAFFEPLGMTRTGLFGAGDIVARRARGYVRGRRVYHNARLDPENWSHSAGGLSSTLDDLAKWDRALREGDPIRPGSLARMLEPTPLAGGALYPYGFGWGTADYGGAPLHHHTGGISGFACQMARLTGEPLTTIVLSNRYLFPFDRVTRGLLRIAMGLPPLVAPDPSASPKELAGCAGRFSDDEGNVLTVGAGHADLSGFVSLGGGRFCDRADPEVEYRFSQSSGDQYQALTYASPLWPEQKYLRC